MSLGWERGYITPNRHGTELGNKSAVIFKVVKSTVAKHVAKILCSGLRPRPLCVVVNVLCDNEQN
jgi:hypothetical protein